MKHFFSLLLVGCLFLFAGCEHGQDYDDSPRANLEALWKIIDEHYCFLDYKSQEIGLDWDRVHDKYLGMLGPEMSRTQLFEVLCAMLSELQDGHVNLYTSADVGRYWSWKEDYPSNLDYELRQSYLGDDYRISAGLKYRILPDNVGYVVYESFSNSFGEGNLDDMMYYLRLCNGIILDIRGNGGGILTNSQRLAARFTNDKLLVGYICHKEGPGRSDFSKPREIYLEPSKGIRWQRPVVVLTNRECFSSANDFVCNIRECPQATVLGDRTGGGGGMPFSSELPIGWAVRFSACPTFDAQMHHIEFGIDPDVFCQLSDDDVKRGEDTLIEAARRLINEK